MTNDLESTHTPCANNWRFTARAGAIIVLGLCLGSGGGAFAATGQIEEIVVTAQKREASLQDTPIAITAMSREQIELGRITNVADVALHTPSMTYNELQGHSQIALRGVGSDLTSLASESAVALYQDGVFRGASFSAAVPQFDLERIEVLRGPQGTLYGRNSVGGAVNMITRMPSEVAEFNGSVTTGNYGRIRTDLGVSGPINNRVSGRASFVFNRHAGFADNKTIGRDEAKENLKSGSVTLVLDMTDTTELILRGNVVKNQRDVGQPIGIQSGPNALGITPNNAGGFLTFPDPALGGASLADVLGLTFPEASRSFVVDPDSLDYFLDRPMERESSGHGFSVTLTQEIGDVTAKLILAKQDGEYKDRNDADGVDIFLLHADGTQRNRQTTAELNLSGTYADGRATWIAGGFWYQEDGYSHLDADLPALQTLFEVLFGVGPGGLALPPFDQSELFTHGPDGPGPGGQPSAAPFVNFRGNQDSKSYAVFGQTTFDATQRLHLTLGARYTKDTKRVFRETAQNIGAACAQRVENDWNEVTGTAIANYDISDEMMAYVSASKGFKSGGFNVAECGDAVFDPETILAYEIGVKSRLLENRLQLNAAAFIYDWKDIQINRFVNTAITITNAAEAKALGVELEFIALITTGLQFDGGITYLNTEYAGGSSFTNVLSPDNTLISVDGNDLMRAPEWKTYLGAQYDWDTSIGRFTLRGDMTYSGKHYFDTFEAKLPNQTEMEQDSYVIGNAQLRWESLDGRYTGQLFVKNMGDTLYAQLRAVQGTIGGIFGAYSEPRQFGISLGVQLGGS